jgi:Protein of unknown function (DUF4242)
MSVFMVERHLPGVTPEQLGGAQQAAITTSQRFTASGKPVRYIRSTFVPDEAVCFCLFEASMREHVREVNDAASLPYRRIVEALDLTPVLAVLLLTVSMLAVGCERNPIAPSRGTGPVAAAQGFVAGASSASARPSAECSNVKATVVATLSAGTASGTITGDLNGPVSATIDQVSQSGNGDAGALHVLMRHHYTNLSPFGRIDTSDHAVLAPIDRGAGLYRMNNRLTVVSGHGIYTGATGYLHTHGTVDFGTGAIDLSLTGRVCAASASPGWIAW